MHDTKRFYLVNYCDLVYSRLPLSRTRTISNTRYLKHALSRTRAISNTRYLEHALSRIRAISNTRYLEHRAISNKTLGPFSTNPSGVTTRYLKLPAISNFLPGPLRVRDSGSRLYIRPDRETRAIALAHAHANCFTRVIIARADANFNEINS